MQGLAATQFQGVAFFDFFDKTALVLALEIAADLLDLACVLLGAWLCQLLHLLLHPHLFGLLLLDLGSTIALLH